MATNHFVQFITLKYHERFFMIMTLIGKSFAHFSAIYFLTPLVGVFFSLPQAACLTVLIFASKALLTSYPITGGIPTLCATLAWATHAQFMNKKNRTSYCGYFLTMAALPALCMALFMTHPTVGQGYVYALYWLIPILLYALHIISGYSSTFTTALSATFIAHAVGSTLWLFTVPMQPEQWLSLIPIVPVERIITALSMTLLCVITKKILSYAQINNKSAKSCSSISDL